MRNLYVANVTRARSINPVEEDVVCSFYAVDEEDVICSVLRSGSVVEGSSVVGIFEGGIESAAVSPDEEILAVCTASKTLVLMTTTAWEVIIEVELDDVGSSCSWRGDGEFLAVFLGGVQLQVYTRDGSLSATSEETRNISEPVTCCAFGRSGGFIAAAIKVTGQVIFYERNALRHQRSDFTIHFPSQSMSSPPLIHQLAWNADGELLAVMINNSEALIYNQSNYHWYLKQCLIFDGDVDRLVWDLEQPYRLKVKLCNGRQDCFIFDWMTTVSTDESNTVAVIDGADVLLTPLQRCVIPPPMSFRTIRFPSAVNGVFFPTGSASLHVLLADGSIRTEGDTNDSNSVDTNTAHAATPSAVARIPIMPTMETVVYVSNSDDGLEQLICVDLQNQKHLSLPHAEGSPITALSKGTTGEKIWISTTAKNGRELRQLDLVRQSVIKSLSFDSDVLSMRAVYLHGDKLEGETLIVLCRGGLLQALHVETDQRTILSAECTSYALTEQSLMFTTRSQALFVIHFDHEVIRNQDD